MRKMTRVCALLLASWTVEAAAQEVASPVALDGVWYGNEIDEEGFAVSATVTGNTVVANELGVGSPPRTFTFTPLSAQGNHLTVSVSGEGQTANVHLLFRSDHEALLWVEDESELVHVRRGGELPAALIGDWDVDSTRPRVSDPPMQLSISASQLTLTENSQARTYSVFPLAPTSSAIEVALVQVGGSDRLVLSFEPLEEGVYLISVSGDDDGMVAFRTGARPAWLTPE